MNNHNKSNAKQKTNDWPGMNHLLKQISKYQSLLQGEKMRVLAAAGCRNKR